MSEVLMRLEGIYKQFPGVMALDNVNLEIRAGEVLALVGENGAGKSTLIKIMSGAYTPSKGTLYIAEKQYEKLTPGEALEFGIAAIHQELNNVGGLSIAENIFLNNQPRTKAGLVDYRTMWEASRKAQEAVGLQYLSPKTLMHRLSTAEKQLVEIARAYVKDLKVMIMDEPTSALNQEEIRKLNTIIRQLRSEGKGIIYISHKLDEVFELADRIQVLRNGASVYEVEAGDATRDAIITSMCGRELKDMYPVSKREMGEVVLEVNHLTDDFLQDVSFNVRRGEILGLYGLMGCGNAEAIESIFGARRYKGGDISIKGKRAEIRSPRQAASLGIAYVPAERKTEGLILGHSVRSNLSIVTLGQYRRGIFLNLAAEMRMAKDWISRLSIKTPKAETAVSTLSGGNQQKIVIAKWLANKPDVFLLNDPTRGVDVGAKVEIYKEIDDLCRAGCAVVYVASELPELLGIADRVYVFHEGRINGEFSGSEITQKNIIASAIGEEAYGM